MVYCSIAIYCRNFAAAWLAPLGVCITPYWLSTLAEHSTPEFGTHYTICLNSRSPKPRVQRAGAPSLFSRGYRCALRY